MAKPGEQVQPAAHQLHTLTAGQRGCFGRGETGFLRQHQAEQQAVNCPGEAAARQAAPLLGIEAPAEAAALQQRMERCHLSPTELEVGLKGRALQQGFQGRCGEPFSGQRQQRQQAAAEAGLTLLAAVGEAPVEAHAGGASIAEHGRHQGRQGIHLGRHHQHVPGLEGGVCGHQLQDAIAHDLHLAQGARTAVKLQGAVCLSQLQLGLASRIHQLLLQLMQQGCRPRAAMPGGGSHKQILLLPLAQLAFAAALEQLLKFAAQAPETGLHPRGLQQPVAIKGLTQCDGIAEQLATTGAALPQVAAGREQVEIHLGVEAQGLKQLHLDRRQAAEPKEAQGVGQLHRHRRALLQQGDGLKQPQSEGFHPQEISQLQQQRALPGLLGRTGLAGPPGRQQVRAIEARIVEGVGDAAGQLPLGPIKFTAAALAAAPPVAQGGSLGLLHQLGQQVQHRPHQLVGPPGIPVAGGIGQQPIDDPAQLAAWKGIADVGRDAPEVQGQLLAEPAAGGPGVHHHLHLLEGPRGVQPQLGGQEFGQMFCPVAPEDGEQGLGSAVGDQGRQLWSCWLKLPNWPCCRPGTERTAPVSGQ